MHNAATIAGLGFGNSLAAMAHAMGHSLGAAFHTPHGRAVGLALPYTIEFTGEVMAERYADIARFVGMGVASAQEAPRMLAQKIRELARSIRQPVSLPETGVSAEQFEAALPKLVENAENDATLVASARIPNSAEVRRLYHYVFAGKPVDF
jgi:alcohol dehydrogenase class IV